MLVGVVSVQQGEVVAVNVRELRLRFVGSLLRLLRSHEHLKEFENTLGGGGGDKEIAVVHHKIIMYTICEYITRQMTDEIAPFTWP